MQQLIKRIEGGHNVRDFVGEATRKLMASLSYESMAAKNADFRDENRRRLRQECYNRQAARIYEESGGEFGWPMGS